MQKSSFEPTTLETETEIKTIEQIRKLGIDKEMRERIAQERAEIERQQQEARERLPGRFISLKEDREEKVLLFSGQYQRIGVPATDFVTKAPIPNKTIQRWRFQCYDVTSPDNLNPEPAIYERGAVEARQILDYLEKGDCELVIRRNGRRNDQKTTYTIYPARR